MCEIESLPARNKYSELKPRQRFKAAQWKAQQKYTTIRLVRSGGRGVFFCLQTAFVQY